LSPQGTTRCATSCAEYAETLAAAGVPVDYECIEGTIHGFMNMGRVLRKAHGRTRRRIAAWLAERLREV
jgi:acetyl esterase